MSERTVRFAIEEMAKQEPDSEFGWLMFALLEEIDFDYERWCRIMEVDPDDQDIFEEWRAVNAEYAEAWKHAGESGFGKRMVELGARWRRLLAYKGE